MSDEPALKFHGTCDENGGCPMWWDGVRCRLARHFPLEFPRDCHLTPADFPIISAMIAGEWKCAKCGHHGIYASGEIFCIFTGTPAPDPCSSWHSTWEER